ncbi:MAG: aldo/keto reductase [Rhodospirillaceae bacterium]|jgi:aryl-alcohol dehydrogenase-like predicted oxidoreductase|nr:aldo/keto reductase [Rhodospirillaceae bacterium]MBT5459501.1 aldo/keto reductase [Rhodospirillaceae bacterium]
MDTRRIGGANGIDLPIVGLGCNAFGRRLDEEASRPVIHAALDAGVTFFDTAEGYGDGLSEEFIGRALEGRRDEVILATKFGLRTAHIPGKAKGSRENAMAAIDKSLKRLRTDHIDLYQLHMPDPSTPIAETLEAMNDMVKAGKVRLIGCSNFSAAQLREAIQVAADRGLDCFVTAQNQWSVLDRDIEGDLVPVCADNEIGILPYYPLAKGLLTGKYRRDAAAPQGSRLAGSGDLSRADFETIEKLEQFATGRGFNLLTLAVSWLASQPTTASVISGASRAEQLSQNATAANWKMTPEDLAEIDKIVG